MEAIKIVQNCLENYSELLGTKALNLLLESPDVPLYAINLAYAVKHGKHSISLQSCNMCVAPIPMTDAKTLHEINKRLNVLIAMKAELTKPEYEDEIKALIRYRRQCVRPGGFIRNFRDDDVHAYQMISTAIKRVLNKAEADGHHEAVAIIKANLKQGKMFKWDE